MGVLSVTVVAKEPPVAEPAAADGPTPASTTPFSVLLLLGHAPKANPPRLPNLREMLSESSAG